MHYSKSCSFYTAENFVQFFVQILYKYKFVGYTKCLFIKVRLEFPFTNVNVSYHPKVFGRQFHSAGPEKEKARSANFVRSLGFE